MTKALLYRNILFLLACFFAAGVVLAQVAAFSLSEKGPNILPLNAGLKALNQCSRNTPEGVSGFWVPSKAQVATLESLLPAYLMTLRTGRKETPHPEGKYGRQYIGIIKHGKRLIYGNFYRAYHDERAKNSILSSQTDRSPVNVCDGGHGYWGIVFNPSSNDFSDLELNGLA